MSRQPTLDHAVLASVVAQVGPTESHHLLLEALAEHAGMRSLAGAVSGVLNGTAVVCLLCRPAAGRARALDRLSWAAMARATAAAYARAAGASAPARRDLADPARPTTPTPRPHCLRCTSRRGRAPPAWLSQALSQSASVL